MPYASDAQRRYMHARHPEIARRWDSEEKKAAAVGAGGTAGAVALAPVRRAAPDAAHSTVHARLSSGGKTALSPSEYRAIAQGTGFRLQNTRYTAGLASAMDRGEVKDGKLRVRVYDDKVVPRDGAHRASANSMLGRATDVEVERVRGRAPRYTTLLGRTLEERAQRRARRGLRATEGIGGEAAHKLYRRGSRAAMRLNRFWSGGGRGMNPLRNPATTAATAGLALGGGGYAAHKNRDEIKSAFGKERTDLARLGEFSKASWREDVDPMSGTTPMQMVYRTGMGLRRGRLSALSAGGATAAGTGAVERRRRKGQQR